MGEPKGECPDCGSEVEYDPDAGFLWCPDCGWKGRV